MILFFVLKLIEKNYLCGILIYLLLLLLFIFYCIFFVDIYLY